ncbi:MAG TPA: ABC transporter substrate-binding protein [Pyrinomonadaceae bacterium]|nr:ABC transporter substrate-binding protein [Pyrinomonadaceae bacterium]
MRARGTSLLLLALMFLSVILPTACRRRTNTFIVALGDNIRTIDPIGSPSVDAASERVRTLMFNSLVRKNEKFDYVGELASEIRPSDDGLTYTFILHDGVKFHDGRPLTSADAKYTMDTLLANTFAKSASFYEGSGANRQSYIKSVEAPDPKTLVITLTTPWGLLTNLVPISIIPKDSYATQKDHPLGSGPFKFVSYDNSQQVLDLIANTEYWQGSPNIQSLRVRVITEPNALQSELSSGRTDLAPLPTNLSPDAINSLKQDPNLQVLQFNGSNVNLLTFNTAQAPLNEVRVRQAICSAIDRESLIRDLLLGQAKIAHSILPEESSAYTPGHIYAFDPATAKKLLDEAGFRDPDGDGPRMRFDKPIVFKISGASIAARNYAGVIFDYLKAVGVPVSIVTTEFNTLIDELRRGNFQIAYGQWVGGNQDPVFYKDLFHTSEIPSETRAGRNRSRYSNKELDALLDEAIKTFDREKAKVLYAKIQEIVSRDAPILPLWYQANMVIAKKNVGNIKVDASGDWSFIKNVTVN